MHRYRHGQVPTPQVRTEAQAWVAVRATGRGLWAARVPNSAHHSSHVDGYLILLLPVISSCVLVLGAIISCWFSSHGKHPQKI